MNVLSTSSTLICIRVSITAREVEILSLHAKMWQKITLKRIHFDKLIQPLTLLLDVIQMIYQFKAYNRKVLDL